MEKVMTKRSMLKINNIPRNLIAWLTDIIENNGCKIEETEWKSKYNNYVVYNYEPFCSEGFIVSILYSGPSLQHCKFIEYLYNKRIANTEFLEKIWDSPTIGKSFYQECRELGAQILYARKD